MNSRTYVGIAGLVGLIVLSAAVAAAIGGGVERMLTVFLINLIAVLGIGVYSGNSGILSFGHLAFMGIAAYLSGILTMPVAMKQLTLSKLPPVLATANLDLLTATIVTVVFVMLVAAVIGIVISRLDGSAATIATLAVLIIIHGLIIGARDITRGSQSFFGVPRETDLLAAAVGATVAIFVARFFRDSVAGMKLRASRDDGLAAGAMGVNVRRHRLLAWVVSAGIVAIAGVLLGHFLGAFSAKKFYFVDTFLLLSMLIVGGMATVSGALAGAVLITAVTEILRRLEGGVEIIGIQLPALFGTTQIGIGLIILAVMYRKSGGLLERDEWDEILLKKSSHTPMQAVTELELNSVDDADFKVDAHEVTKSFDGLVALENVSVSIKRGEIVGLIGPNGSGKTTLLNIMSGMMPASRGRVYVGGVDLTGRSSHVFATHGVGRTFQNIRLFSSLTVRNNVLVAALMNWPRTSVKQALGLANQAMEAMGLHNDSATFASTLSYGGQRRVEIARALALRPRFLFLDEPAAGMNREETDALMGDLRKLNETHRAGILVIDHDLPLIMELCDRIIVLNEGKLIAEGSPMEVQTHPAVIEAYLGRRSSQQVT